MLTPRPGGNNLAYAWDEPTLEHKLLVHVRALRHMHTQNPEPKCRLDPDPYLLLSLRLTKERSCSARCADGPITCLLLRSPGMLAIRMCKCARAWSDLSPGRSRRQAAVRTHHDLDSSLTLILTLQEADHSPGFIQALVRVLHPDA